jgi:hypothetical protein
MREAQCVVRLWTVANKRVSQPVTLRHKVSHSVTIVTPTLTVKRFRSLAVLHGPARNRKHGMTNARAAVAPES